MMTGNPPPTWQGKHRRWNRTNIVAALIAFAIGWWLFSVLTSCKGTRSEGVTSQNFTTGTPKHPARYDTLWAELSECFARKEYGARAHDFVPLDSAVRSWRLVEHPDDLPKRQNGEPASASWDVNKHEIILARPAINTWTEPLHEMGHAWQAAHQSQAEDDPGGVDAWHGPKFNGCVNREG